MLLCSAALLPCTASAQAVHAETAAEERADSAWVLQKLARPAPMRTSFVELRDSPLLKAPLRLSGEYQRPRDDTLVREVRAPYAETTTIRAGQATIVRAGKSPRTFSLSRVPELASLQASFGAMLSGDRAALEKYYRVETEGTRRRWTMTLLPKDAQLAARVRDITLYGRGAELRCIQTRSAPTAKGKAGEIQRTLLAGAARAADKVATTDALARLCHGDATG